MKSPNIPVIRDPKSLLLSMAQQRSVADVLRLVVDHLSTSEAVALARIWLIRPGEGCLTCPMRNECPDQTQCLHLVASAGHSIVNPEADLTRVDGEFRRFPLGIRKVGRIAATGTPMEIQDIDGDPDWLVKLDWAKSENIRGFGGQPLIHRGRSLGVLGVFARTAIGDACLDWMRMIADHVASAIANAEAWEEIETLRSRLEQENDYLQEELRGEAFGEMVGQSDALQTVAQQIRLVAPTDSTVLVMGESGTGKELVAREIHARSDRHERPLIKVNCAAIPRELYESEFFGHTKGSFTGALRDRIGRFELADGGTLFLDEIGEIPLDLQSKLLRVLQEGELERVGEERTRNVNVRVIAATNRDLKAEAEAGNFRSDLYYRLSVFPIELPPLRHRKDDLPLLAHHLLSILSRRLGKPIPRLTQSNVQQMQRYDWPGNIRELQHVLERALITSPPGKLRLELTSNASSRPAPMSDHGSEEEVLTLAQMKAFETANLQRALAACNGKVYGESGAAKLLGMKPTTLASRMKTLGIDK
ncbi:sigma-54-dependent Fis family transcriptional regulator [Rhodopirellula halodulae]|uniref:sigma-54-dependent Fis family transcriptional regulator n=1 Tax=Rhodopirellula halodulae TaxID=2894198 RepID=UPI001E483318|nr:sigma 54-interacting transcriptional regulator [Rhodopirellula sp. JC737]MCC9654303.1 sigma 54-interacting transcriptional regulator [Rhodopirellula sp. JC737]